MSVVLLRLLVVASLLGGARTLHGQAAPSPTLPSDTLEANYAPRSGSGPTPELAPSLPSDTLDAIPPSAPAPDSVPQEPPPAASPVMPDSAHSAEPSWAPWRLIPLEPPPARVTPVSV
jgi:hypothetical protein